MKIAMIAPFAIYPKGTVRVRMLPIARELTKKGHEVSIIIPPYDNLSHSGLEYADSGVRIVNVDFKDYKLIKYLLTTFMIILKTLQLNPNVIYIFKPKGYSGLTAMVFAITKTFGLLKKSRLVLDMDDWEGYGGFNDYYMEHSVYPRIMLDFFDFQERWIPKHVNSITVASKTLEERVLGWGLPSSIVFYVPNGASLQTLNISRDDAKVLRKKLGLDDMLVILLYTRFFEYRVNKVVEIFKHVTNKLDSVKLLVVGKGEFGEEEELKNLVVKEELEDSVVFTGWIEPEDIPKYLAVGDVAIYPFDDTPLNRAKCPGKLVELMFAGKAVVAERVGQIMEYIQDGESGVLVDSEDVNAFASSVVNVLKNAALRNMLNHNARKRVLTNYNWTKLTTKVEQAFIPNFGIAKIKGV